MCDLLLLNRRPFLESFAKEGEEAVVVEDQVLSLFTFLLLFVFVLAVLMLAMSKSPPPPLAAVGRFIRFG